MLACRHPLRKECQVIPSEAEDAGFTLLLSIGVCELEFFEKGFDVIIQGVEGQPAHTSERVAHKVMCVSFEASGHHHTFAGMVDNLRNSIFDIRFGTRLVSHINVFTVLDGDSLCSRSTFFRCTDGSEHNSVRCLVATCSQYCNGNEVKVFFHILMDFELKYVIDTEQHGSVHRIGYRYFYIIHIGVPGFLI